MKNIMYFGMDVHKEKIFLARSDRAGKAEQVGLYTNNKKGITKLIKQLIETQQEYEIKVCYEAGPLGYTLKRTLDKEGIACAIIAPSLIPSKAGDRIKTDKRDAAKLARLFRAGELTSITVPSAEQESVRSLVRCRQDIQNDVRRMKQRIVLFLLKLGFHFERSNWTQAYYIWLKSRQLDDPMHQRTLEYYINTLEGIQIQLTNITAEIKAIAHSAPYKPAVMALTAFRGISELTAMILLSEIMDFRRFKSPAQLMSYIGLVPSEYSSGGRVQKGRITRCGNARVRTTLIEVAWHYVKPATISTKMKPQLEAVPHALRIPPTKALKRLNKKFYALIHKKKERSKAVVAIARELVGFIWHSMVLVEGHSHTKVSSD